MVLPNSVITDQDRPLLAYLEFVNFLLKIYATDNDIANLYNQVRISWLGCLPFTIFTRRLCSKTLAYGSALSWKQSQRDVRRRRTVLALQNVEELVGWTPGFLVKRPYTNGVIAAPATRKIDSSRTIHRYWWGTTRTKIVSRRQAAEGTRGERQKPSCKLKNKRESTPLFVCTAYAGAEWVPGTSLPL